MSSTFSNSYDLLWLNNESSQFAEVRNYYADNPSKYRFFKIINDDAKIKAIPMRFLAVSANLKDPYILASNEFLKLPRSLQAAAIWHEIGHIHHGHKQAGSQEEIRKLRLSYIDSNQVMPDELEADQFATKRAGRDSVSRFIEHLIRTRPVGKEGDLNELGRKELQLRLDKLRSMGNEPVGNK